MGRFDREEGITEREDEEEGKIVEEGGTVIMDRETSKELGGRGVGIDGGREGGGLLTEEGG